MRRSLFFAALLLLPAVAAGVLAGWSEALVYDRSAVAHGEVWRLLTGHWVHFSGGHMRADAAALLFGAGLVNGRQTRAWLLTLALAAGLIPVALWIGSPELARYGGLSGLALATWTFAAVGLARSSRGLSATVFTLVTAKVLAESLTGQFALAELPEAEMVPATLAHCVGALVGIAGGMWGRKQGSHCGRNSAARALRLALPRLPSPIATSRGIELWAACPASRTDPTAPMATILHRKAGLAHTATDPATVGTAGGKQQPGIPMNCSRPSAQRAGWQPALRSLHGTRGCVGQVRMPRMTSPSTLVRRRLMPLW